MSSLCHSRGGPAKLDSRPDKEGRRKYMTVIYNLAPPVENNWEKLSRVVAVKLGEERRFAFYRFIFRIYNERNLKVTDYTARRGSFKFPFRGGNIQITLPSFTSSKIIYV